MVNTQPQHTRQRSVSQMTNVQVQFLVTTSRPNMTQEVAEIIKKQCEASKVVPDTCILPGGLVVMKDSITVDDKGKVTGGQVNDSHGRSLSKRQGRGLGNTGL